MTLLCWQCGQALIGLQEENVSSELLCPNCKSVTGYQDGIYRTLSPLQQESYGRFITDYESIRAAEGRGSSDAAFYRALPYEDLSGKLVGQWKIRARTFDYLMDHVLPNHSARVLDLGAGNGWLSYRLALQGHKPVAVDLLTNPSDGLAAANHFPTRFPRVQAALDHLPFPSEAFDVALFNASFHYAENYQQTLAEALRCTRKGGIVVIADTPWYAKESSGLQMVAEKQKRFRSSYGFASNSIASQEFLTPTYLRSLALDLGLKWKVHKPFYGLNWALRPLKAKLLNRRAPSHFRIFVAEVAA
jgi:SAM-dependent methyltransferase